MSQFDYQAPAEVFPSRRYSKRRPITYRRFVSAARAIQFVIEELEADFLLGTMLEVEEERFEGRDIRRLYDSPAYPLPRLQAA